MPQRHTKVYQRCFRCAKFTGIFWDLDKDILKSQNIAVVCKKCSIEIRIENEHRKEHDLAYLECSHELNKDQQESLDSPCEDNCFSNILEAEQKIEQLSDNLAFQSYESSHVFSTINYDFTFINSVIAIHDELLQNLQQLLDNEIELNARTVVADTDTQKPIDQLPIDIREIEPRNIIGTTCLTILAPTLGKRVTVQKSHGTIMLNELLAELQKEHALIDKIIEIDHQKNSTGIVSVIRSTISTPTLGNFPPRVTFQDSHEAKLLNELLDDIIEHSTATFSNKTSERDQHSIVIRTTYRIWISHNLPHNFHNSDNQHENGTKRLSKYFQKLKGPLAKLRALCQKKIAKKLLNAIFHSPGSYLRPFLSQKLYSLLFLGIINAMPIAGKTKKEQPELDKLTFNTCSK